MKNCTDVMERYLSLDKGEHIPLWITWHFLTCSRCRKEVRLLRKAEIASSKPTSEQVQLNDESIKAVMKKIVVAQESQKNPISLSKWVLGGILMATLFLVYTMFTKRSDSSSLSILTYLELAAFITVYCSLFIRSNMDFFVKLINTKIPSVNFQAY